MHRYYTTKFLAWALLAVGAIRSVAGAGVLDNLYHMPTTTFAAQPYSYLNFNSVGLLDQDLKTINARLAAENADGMLAAQRVFEKGAYSEAFAVFTFSDVNFINLDIPPGIVDGKTASGADVRGISHYGSPFGNNTLTVHYPVGGTTADSEVDMVTGTLESMGGGAFCRVGGNPSPVTDGCFAPSGTIRVLDALDFSYSYDPLRDNANGLSMAILANDRTLAGPTLQKYINYYGTTDYDRTWIRSAFAGIETPGFTNGVTSTNMNFSRLSVEGRHSAIKWGLVVLKVWIFVVNTIEVANILCPDAKDDAILAMDRAVAAFAGSGPIAQIPSSEDDGYFLYNLIETECKNFGSCSNWDSMAPLNKEILGLMDSARKQLSITACPSVQTQTRRIVELLTIPLIQGILRNAYALDLNENVQGWTQGQTAAYAAAVAPLLNDCSAGNAFVIIDDLAAGKAPGASFEVIKETLERSYSCLRLTCEDIDGLRAVNSNAYEKGAEPCGTVGSAYTDPSVQAPTPALPGFGPTSGTPPATPGIPALPSIPTKSSSGTATNNNNNIPKSKGSNWKAGTTTKARIPDLGPADVATISITIAVSVLAAAVSIGYCCWDAKKTKEFDTARQQQRPSDIDTGAAPAQEEVEEPPVAIEGATSQAQIV